MYDLPHFKEHDPAVIRAFMAEHPFALLAGCNAAGQPVATQVPLLTEERGGQLFLLGHIQRKTDHQLAFAANPHVLAVFTGPDSYVSASWYADPRTPSTWNYMAVHARGRLRFLDDDGLWHMLERTTARFEHNDFSPASFRNIPEADIRKMMKAITAFEITVDHLDHVFKLSQNRGKANYTSIAGHLSELDSDARAVAAEMEKRLDEISPAQDAG